MNDKDNEPLNDRNLPISDIDAQFMVIDPAWGKEVTTELNEKLKELDQDGKISKKKLWGLLSYYTRDLRLGNLSNFDIYYCQVYLDFAGDCLRENYLRSFMTSLSRVVTVIELSQSRAGFLRKRLNTLTKESYMNALEPEKKGFFSMKKGGSNGQNQGQYNQGGGYN